MALPRLPRPFRYVVVGVSTEKGIVTQPNIPGLSFSCIARDTPRNRYTKKYIKGQRVAVNQCNMWVHLVPAQLPRPDVWQSRDRIPHTHPSACIMEYLFPIQWAPLHIRLHQIHHHQCQADVPRDMPVEVFLARGGTIQQPLPGSKQRLGGRSGGGGALRRLLRGHCLRETGRERNRAAGMMHQRIASGQVTRERMGDTAVLLYI